jgi:hypothetical protein
MNEQETVVMAVVIRGQGMLRQDCSELEGILGL